MYARFSSESRRFPGEEREHKEEERKEGEREGTNLFLQTLLPLQTRRFGHSPYYPSRPLLRWLR